MLGFPTHVRLATDIATQKRYIILAVRGGLVHVFGDVYHVKGLRPRHKPGIQYQRELVSIEEVRYTKDLLRQLLRQYLSDLRKRGYDVTMGLSRKGEITYEAINGTSRLVVS